MYWHQSGTDIFVRIDPSENLVDSLRKVAIEAEIRVAAIVSGVGMVSMAQMGFFDVEKDDYDVSLLEGIFDLSSVLGNITRKDEEVIPHVHAVFNAPDFSTYSGHIVDAVAHITIEVFLSTSTLELKRVKLPSCPATRIVGTE